MMYLLTIFTAVVTATTASSASEPPSSIPGNITAITDKLLFDTTLRDFIVLRENKTPRTVDWTSDGCTGTADNPFKFPFLPACQRHDFGYTNYRAQKRFTRSGKRRIDGQFRTDLYFQCQQVKARGVCKALANIYYAGARLFGGRDQKPGKRMDQESVSEYQRLIEIYEEEVRKAQNSGDLPLLK
ncbi:p15 like protein [Metarhizium album ARSEF 1941]|uniref:p15 like protein n=1 Tax=Metarhizium album (strain ARSEF 1941) TaxID=1081103 RepID=A0A0B2WJJ8_METAS|nr:p15 like protein [Metarhizium album ARSEF 1941]KHN94108.1 p15 like protein [Metarhizium album ARSEF 1941]